MLIAYPQRVMLDLKSEAGGFATTPTKTRRRDLKRGSLTLKIIRPGTRPRSNAPLCQNRRERTLRAGGKPYA